MNQYKLKEVTKLIKDGTHGTHLDYHGDNRVMLLSAKDITDGKLDIANDPRYISFDDFQKIHKNYSIQNEDILISLVGSIGNIAIVSNYENQYTFQRSVGIVRADNRYVYPKYLYYIFVAPAFRKSLLKYENKGAQGGVYLGSLSNIKISLPPLNIQSKIVSILETYDNYLELLNKKINIKKNIKKYLMQVLLTGKIRLKGYSEGWEEKKLGDIGTTYSGLTGKTIKDFGKGKKYISYMNIYSNTSVDTNINSYVEIGENENQNKAKLGDIFFTTSSETPHEVGISSVLNEDIEDLYLNSFCFGFRPNKDDILYPLFSKYYFRGTDFRKKMTRIAQGASRYNLSKKYFLDTTITYPLLPEQQSISNILSISDKEIEILEKKKELVLKQKKYLLNNLVTGYIEVKV